MSFKKDFIWGTATASYQIEGSTFADGKGRNIWDDYCEIAGKVKDASDGTVACDHYNRYKEDVALLKQLGVKAYRFSISWARILPEGTGKINQKGIDFYNNLIDELIKNGIEPYITLYHWDYPSALMLKGGWGNPESPDWFAEYTKVVAKAFGDRVKNYMTFNEPSAVIGCGCVIACHAPGIEYPVSVTVKMTHNVLKAHGMAVKVLRENVPDCKVGYAPCSTPCTPATDSAKDIEAARQQYFKIQDNEDGFVWNIAWWSDPVVLGKYPEEGLKRYEKYLPEDYEKDMEIICQPLDFFGHNIYKGCFVKAGENGPEVLPFPVGYPQNTLGWWLVPTSLYWGPRFLYERYKLPIIITESGISGKECPSLDGKVHDPHRVDYLHRCLNNLKKASEDGADIAGYFVWSLMDNFEWAAGYTERFGLIHVDYQTQKRTPKDSYYWYKEVVSNNGENL